MMAIQDDLEDLKSCIHGNCAGCRFTYASRQCLDYQTDIIEDAILVLDKQKSIIEEYIEKENKQHGRRKKV